MKINAFQQQPTTRPLNRPTPPPQKPEAPQPSEKFELTTAAGALGGAILGAFAGAQGPAGLASVAGLGAAAATAVAVGPTLHEGIQQSLNGDPLNDIATTCGTIAAGGFLLASVAGAGGGLGYVAGIVAPVAGPVVGGLIGASVGAYLASKAA